MSLIFACRRICATATWTKAASASCGQCLYLTARTSTNSASRCGQAQVLDIACSLGRMGLGATCPFLMPRKDNHSVSSALTVPEQTLLCFLVLVTLACLPAPLRSLLKRTLQRGAAATCRCCALRASPPPMCGSTTCGTTGRSITPSCWSTERCVSHCKAGAIHAAPAARANIIACCA